MLFLMLISIKVKGWECNDDVANCCVSRLKLARVACWTTDKDDIDGGEVVFNRVDDMGDDVVAR